MSKNYGLRGHFSDQHGEGNKHCWNQEGTTFSLFIDHCEGNWVDLLLIREVLKVFLNAMTARDKYSLRNRNNLTEPIEKQLYEKQEFLSNFFCIFEIYIKF